MLKQLLMLLWVADSSLPSLVSMGTLITQTMTHRLLRTTQGGEGPHSLLGASKEAAPRASTGYASVPIAGPVPSPGSQVRGEIPGDFHSCHTAATGFSQCEGSNSSRWSWGDNFYVSRLRYQLSKQSGIQVNRFPLILNPP